MSPAGRPISNTSAASTQCMASGSGRPLRRHNRRLNTAESPKNSAANLQPATPSVRNPLNSFNSTQIEFLIFFPRSRRRSLWRNCRQQRSHPQSRRLLPEPPWHGRQGPEERKSHGRISRVSVAERQRRPGRLGAPRQGRGGRFRAFAGRPALGRRLDGQDAGRLLHPGLPEGDGRRRRHAGPDRWRHLLRQPHRRRQRRFRVAVGAAALLRPALRLGVGAHAGERGVARSSRWACPTSNSPRPACPRSAKWSAWRRRPWATACAPPVS